MKTVRIFNPLHVLGSNISVSDIDGLKSFKLYEHPEIRPQIAVMKTEVMKYQALAGSIKSFTYVLRVVLTNSPNSCPSERVFSIRHVTSPFPVSPVPVLVGEVAHRYRL